MKSKPRQILNPNHFMPELECGCRLVDLPLAEKHWEFCPLHQSALALLQALELADALLSQLGRVYNGSSQQRTISAAINKAKGR